MTNTPTDDQPGFRAEKPEHCFACYRLIRPGQTYYLTIKQDVLCADCALVEDVIRVREDLAVEVKRDRLVVRHLDVFVVDRSSQRHRCAGMIRWGSYLS